MGVLSPVVQSTAFAKIAIHGPQGSGKTYTAAQLMIGLSEKYHARKPIAFVDTEKGSDHLKPLFDAHRVPLVGVKTRAFATLMAAFKEAEEAGCCGIIIDSATHFWDELKASYAKKLHRDFGLKLPDWGPIKDQWREFPALILNSRLHVVVCGRAGNVFEEEVDERTGKKEITKVGTKFRAEGEFGYEPDLALEMYLEPSRDPRKKDWDHVCVVLKDRTLFVDPEKGTATPRLNGMEFRNPGFADFQPFFDALNIGGAHVGIGTETSEGIVPDPDKTGFQIAAQRDVLLDKIKAVFTLRGIGGQSTADKKEFVERIRDAFGTPSWREVEGMWPDRLAQGLAAIERYYADIDACAQGSHAFTMDLPGGSELGCARLGCTAKTMRPREPGSDEAQAPGGASGELPGLDGAAEPAKRARRPGAAKV